MSSYMCLCLGANRSKSLQVQDASSAAGYLSQTSSFSHSSAVTTVTPLPALTSAAERMEAGRESVYQRQAEPGTRPIRSSMKPRKLLLLLPGPILSSSILKLIRLPASLLFQIVPSIKPASHFFLWFSLQSEAVQLQTAKLSSGMSFFSFFFLFFTGDNDCSSTPHSPTCFFFLCLCYSQLFLSLESLPALILLSIIIPPPPDSNLFFFCHLFLLSRCLFLIVANQLLFLSPSFSHLFFSISLIMCGDKRRLILPPPTRSCQALV